MSSLYLEKRVYLKSLNTHQGEKELNKYQSKVIILIGALFLLLLLTPLSTSQAAETEIVPVAGMIGKLPPTGTTATSSSEYSGRPATRAIDGNIETEWTGTANSGYVQLNFPQPVYLEFVQVATGAANPSNATFVISGLKNGIWSTINSNYTMSIPTANKTIISEPINVTHGTYDGIKVSITMNASWVGITEITLGDYKTINLSATSGDSQVKLNWNEIQNADSYTVKYGTESGNYTKTTTATKDTYGNFIVPELTNGTTYYFVVSAVINGKESYYSNEASATPEKSIVIPTPDPESSGDRAILVVTMNTGLEKEFDLSIEEVENFISWYEAKQSGTGKAAYAIDKHDNNKGPFSTRKDYVIFDKILTFEVSEYVTN